MAVRPWAVDDAAGEGVGRLAGVAAEHVELDREHLRVPARTVRVRLPAADVGACVLDDEVDLVVRVTGRASDVDLRAEPADGQSFGVAARADDEIAGVNRRSSHDISTPSTRF